MIDDDRRPGVLGKGSTVKFFSLGLALLVSLGIWVLIGLFIYRVLS